MRNRDYKEFAEDTYYHVFNRGVAKQDIFLDKEDYYFFLHRLKENLFPKLSRGTLLYDEDGYFSGTKRLNFPRKVLPEDSFELVCYCLMPNHFHLLIKQKRNIPISKLILKLCTSHSMYFNKKHERVGSLFQDTFKAVAIEDNDYLFWLSLYIHNNPKKADLVDKLEDWEWSSFLDYIGERNGILCNKSIILEQLKSVNNYRKLFEKEKLLASRVTLLGD